MPHAQLARSRRDTPTSAAIAAAAVLVARPANVPHPDGLTRREAQFLPWLATDLGYAAIARQLGYGPHNARLIAQRLLGKLGDVSRPAAVARWLRPKFFTALSESPPT